MATINRFADLHDEITAWRRDFHAHPEIQFDVERTAGVVEQNLKAFGVDEVVTGLGKTGVVGVIHGRKSDSGKVIGMRADMDALPIQEIRDLDYKSTVPGKMHACGHDGHTAMLLGAAKYLAETRNFDGTAVVIFQPAEEDGGGAKVMVDDGIMEQFKINEVYGMHNMPGLPVGEFAIRPGPTLAAADFFTIKIEGVGGHAARPHGCNDPAMVVSQILTGFQTIVARNTDPLDSMVVSTTQIHMGDADNVIPQTAQMSGTVRTLNEDTRSLAETRMQAVCDGAAAAFGATVEFEFVRTYPVTVNHRDQTEFSAGIARGLVGEPRVDDDTPPVMGGEDFSFMLQERPGAFIFIGNGDSAGLHHPEYDFNDEIIPLGCSYWAKLTETAMPLEK